MSAKKNVVIVGAGLAGAQLALKLAKEGAATVSVTLIDTKGYFEVPFATPRCMVEPKFADKAVFAYSDFLPASINFVQGAVTEVASDKVSLADGTDVSFDYLAVCTGSSYPLFKGNIAQDETNIGRVLDAAGRRQEFSSTYEQLAAAKSFLIVGGGAVGVELAGELVEVFPQKKLTVVHSHESLLHFLKPNPGNNAKKWLESKGATVLLNQKVDIANGVEGKYTTSQGQEIQADMVFNCTGIKVNTSYMQANFGQTLEGGYIKVTPELLVSGTKNIFAVGDCNNTPGFKMGYLAGEQAQVAGQNILALAKSGESAKLKQYKAPGAMMVLSMGKGFAVGQLPFGCVKGWPLTSIKSKELFVPKVRSDLGVK